MVVQWVSLAMSLPIMMLEWVSLAISLPMHCDVIMRHKTCN